MTSSAGDSGVRMKEGEERSGLLDYSLRVSS